LSRRSFSSGVSSAMPLRPARRGDVQNGSVIDAD
jgi:hypothetical protein